MPGQTTITSSTVSISSNSTTSVTCTISNAQPILCGTSTYTVASKLLTETSAENVKAWLSPLYLFSLRPRSAKLSCRPQCRSTSRQILLLQSHWVTIDSRSWLLNQKKWNRIWGMLTLQNLTRTSDPVIGSSNYNIRTSKFGVSNSDAFRVAVTLTTLNCQFWHQQLKEDKAYRVVLKGLHTNVPKSQIEQGFTDNGFQDLNIYCPKRLIGRTFRLTRMITKIQ